MEFKSTFFAIIIFSMLVIAIGVILGGWSTNYNSGTTSDLGEFNKLDSLSGNADSHQGRINPQSGEASSDYEAETFRGGYGIITNIYNSFRVVFGDNGMIDSVTERYGLPDYVRQGLVTMFVIAITFGIIYIVFRLGVNT